MILKIVPFFLYKMDYSIEKSLQRQVYKEDSVSTYNT